MSLPVILASGSQIRSQLLQNAGIPHQIVPARVDEASVKQALLAEAASGRDIADALAELKAQKVSSKHPEALVLGCDQVLSLGDKTYDKPTSQSDAMAHLRDFSGKTHQLLSAAVIYENGRPIWRHVGVARLTVRSLSDTFIEKYVTEYWDDIRHCVGCYRLEAEGVRLFGRIEGDNFTVLGLPLLELLSYLIERGTVRL